LVVAFLAFFVAVAFCAVMFHVNRMTFGPPGQPRTALEMPWSCRATLAVAGLPLLAIGLYVPGPLRDLLMAAAKAMGG
jgi:hypothetical protein